MLKVIFEDKYIIVCVKPHGILSQSAPGEDVSMLSLISEHRKERGENEYVGLVHRLDRGTGGIMVFSKDPKFTGKLSSAVAERKFRKVYIAAVSGKPDEKQGIFKDLLYTDRTLGKSFIADTERKGVKDASLEYETVKTVSDENGEISLIKILLHTGRTHQIRVQFSSRNMPLLGDGKYGSRIKSKNIGLWSYEISFTHPVTGKMLSFKADPPSEYPWNIL